MILSFGDRATEDFYHNRPTHRSAQFPIGIRSAALRKLDILNAAYRLIDLQIPPGNRLEALKGRLDGFYSIRINDQWRLIFRWENQNASEVALVDDH